MDNSPLHHTKPVLHIFLLCAGLSLFSFTVSAGITVTLTDLIIIFSIIYSFIINRSYQLSPVLIAMTFFAITSFLSGFLNTINDHTFFTGNFLANYFRVLGILGMILFFPPLQNKIGHDRLALGTLWTLRIHAILIFADAFFVNPINWEGSSMVLAKSGNDFNRPRGLFIEPSFYGIYAGISLLYILQIERNFKINILKLWDIILFSLSLIASTSASAIGLLILFLYEIFRKYGRISPGKIMISLSALSLIVIILSSRFQQSTWTGLNVKYVIEKVGSLRYGLQNENIRVRIFGGWIFAGKIIEEYPLFGVGLGGENQNRILRRMGEFHEGNVASEQIAYGPGSVMPISVVIFTGFLGLIPYLYTLFWVIKSSSSRIIGKGLIAICFMWGNAFAPIIWWYVCLGISVNYNKNILTS